MNQLLIVEWWGGGWCHTSITGMYLPGVCIVAEVAQQACGAKWTLVALVATLFSVRGFTSGGYNPLPMCHLLVALAATPRERRRSAMATASVHQLYALSPQIVTNCHDFRPLDSPITKPR
jgi:hypothetical protein